MFFFFSNLLRHSTRHIVFDTGNRFSEGPRCPKAPKKKSACEPCCWGAVPHLTGVYLHFLSKTSSGLQPERVAFQQQEIRPSKNKLEDPRMDLKTDLQLTLKPWKTRHRRYVMKRGRSFSFRRVSITYSATAWIQKPTSLLIGCRVSRRIFMVNATTH